MSHEQCRRHWLKKKKCKTLKCGRVDAQSKRSLDKITLEEEEEEIAVAF